MNIKVDRVKALELAEKYVRQGKVKEAISQYEKIISVEPEDAATLNIIGDLYFQDQRPEAAVRYFVRATEEYEKKGMFAQALAVYKKIYKLRPDNVEYAQKLGDLYTREGFLADAKKVFISAAERCLKKDRANDAARILEKVVVLDREDLAARKQLAEVYGKLGFAEAGLEQLNEAAEILIAKGDYAAARKVLKEALTQNPSDIRAVMNLVEVFKKEGHPDKAVAAVEQKLEEKPDDIQLLNLLGNLLFEKGEVEKAEAVFSRIVDGQPMNVNARIKLGRIRIMQDKIDEAFELFGPLVDSLVKKRKEEKAIGLLGLIIEARRDYLPALERLAAIYRLNRDRKKLEVVDRVILKELREKGDEEKMLAVVRELRDICPEDRQLEDEYRALVRTGEPVREKEASLSPPLTPQDRQAIEETIAQADLYLQNGLVRNARRILENLKLRYPEEEQIQQKLAALDQVRTHIDEEELRRRVEQTSVLETKIKEKPSVPGRGVEFERALNSFPKHVVEGDKVSPADVFAETDIIPFIPSEEATFRYYDLSETITEELRMLRMSYEQQAQGETPQMERELSNIVEEFRRDLRLKVKADDCDTHFNLGIAFMEQGLLDAAIEEFSAAARDRKLAVDCFSLISYCHKQKRSFDEAQDWLMRALEMVRRGSEQYYALRYDLAEVLEGADNAEQATALLQEIIAWNPRYRNISSKVERFGKKTDDM
jgi:tetratricopeptide (TPR) repeat protein